MYFGVLQGLQDGPYEFHTGNPHMQNGSYDNNNFKQDAMQVNSVIFPTIIALKAIL